MLLPWWRRIKSAYRWAVNAFRIQSRVTEIENNWRRSGSRSRPLPHSANAQFAVSEIYASKTTIALGITPSTTTLLSRKMAML
jgi:hypothetical protein